MISKRDINLLACRVACAPDPKEPRTALERMTVIVSAAAVWAFFIDRNTIESVRAEVVASTVK
jgi:hypothetical protein